MAVLITWGMGEVGFTVEADNAKEALKVYRGITERTENVAEDRVRQIVNEQTVSVRVDHDSPWAVDEVQKPTNPYDRFSPSVTTYDDPSLLGKMPTVTAEEVLISTAHLDEPIAVPDRPWIDWVYTDEIPIPTELTTGDLIDVEYRDGKTRSGYPYMTVVTVDSREATEAYWRNDASPDDIVKYRRAV